MWSGSDDPPSKKHESGEITVKDQSLLSPVPVTIESKTSGLLFLEFSRYRSSLLEERSEPRSAKASRLCVKIKPVPKSNALPSAYT